MAQPSFYDRDASWVDPLVSAATYAPGRVFGMYRAGEPDPWFLEIEHFGTFYASMAAQPGQRFGEPPLLALAENAGQGGAAPGSTVNMVTAEAHALRHELELLKRSRTRLAKAFWRSCWRKLTGKARRAVFRCAPSGLRYPLLRRDAFSVPSEPGPDKRPFIVPIKIC